MALTLEEIRKNKSQKKNVMNFNSNTESRPFEPVQKGELKKISPDEKLQNFDKKLEKIETRTEYLLEKHLSREAKEVVKEQSNGSESIVKPSPNRSPKIPTAKIPTYMDFVLMKGLKKVILGSIKENIFEENGEYFSFIDTDLIKEKTNSDTNIIRDTIHKLKKDNWFELVQSHYTKRLIKIKKNIYLSHQ